MALIHVTSCGWPRVSAEQCFSLVASGQIKLPKVDGWRRIATVLNQRIAGSDAELRGIAV